MSTVNAPRILIFGDSLTHHGDDSGPAIWDVNLGANRASSAPGDLLASMFYDRGAVVRTDAKSGRSATSYWGSEEGSTMPSDLQFAPTRVIVMLGTNDLERNLVTDAPYMKKIRDSFAAIPGVDIWAVGPPTFSSALLPAYVKQLEPVYTMLRNVFGADRVIDARPMTSTANRSSSGVHFTAAGAKDFATQLFAALQGTSTAVTVVPASGLSTGAKVALGVLGAAGVFGLGWLAVRYARRGGLGGTAESKPPEDTPPPVAEMYVIGEDAIREDNLLEARRIADEVLQRFDSKFERYAALKWFWALKPPFKPPTYAKARESIFDDLQAHGWQVERSLKTPHATSPHGLLRLWFKPQAVHMTNISKLGKQLHHRHDFKDARAIAYDLDIRSYPGPRLREWLLRAKFPQTRDTLGRASRRNRRRS